MLGISNILVITTKYQQMNEKCTMHNEGGGQRNTQEIGAVGDMCNSSFVLV